MLKNFGRLISLEPPNLPNFNDVFKSAIQEFDETVKLSYSYQSDPLGTVHHLPSKSYSLGENDLTDYYNANLPKKQLEVKVTNFPEIKTEPPIHTYDFNTQTDDIDFVSNEKKRLTKEKDTNTEAIKEEEKLQQQASIIKGSSGMSPNQTMQMVYENKPNPQNINRERSFSLPNLDNLPTPEQSEDFQPQQAITFTNKKNFEKNYDVGTIGIKKGGKDSKTYYIIKEKNGKKFAEKHIEN